VPPVAASVVLYAAEVDPAGREVVVMLRGLVELLDASTIVMDKDVVALLPLASVTVNPNMLVPALTGVPEKTPVVVKLLWAISVSQAPEQEVKAQV